MTNEILLGIDAGGTFTDFVALEMGADGTPSLTIHKSLSTPAAPEQAILDGIRAMALEDAMGQNRLRIIHGSTVATNATLEGKVARTAFITNYGFADMLTLARQTRPGLYALEFPPVVPPVPAELCLETGGRLGADGSVVEALSSAEIDTLLASIDALEPEAVAINLLFSFLDDGFEKTIEQAISAAHPKLFISRSSQVLPVYKEYERGIATWLNAALGPVVSGYLGRLRQELGACPLNIMQSNGETMAAERAAESAVHLLLSGPAGGLTAIRYLGGRIGRRRIISFDMGGTSTDVALLDGEINTTREGTIDRFPVGVPMVDMHTIGAGGGSIAFVDEGGMLQVGPRSAGADPGPACYGKGGREATVTDANLVLGRLVPQVALAGSLGLDLSLAQAAIAPLADEIGMGIKETAAGIVSIANEHMAKAIRMISVNRGYDARQFLLASFGGAGGLHVCAIAEAMQMDQAVVPAYGGVLSALGMLVAERGRQFNKTVGLDTAEAEAGFLEREFGALEEDGREQLRAEGLSAAGLEARRSADLRYRGQSYTLNVAFTDLEEAIAAFNLQHQRRYGYALNTGTEIVNLCVDVVHRSPPLVLPRGPLAAADAAPGGKETAAGPVPATDSGIQVLARSELPVGRPIPGPAIITEYAATTYVAPGWSASLDELGNIMLTLDQ